MLTKQEKEDIKQHLIKNINENFPEDKKDFAIKQLLDMDDDSFQEFLIKNKIISPEGEKNQECIFCLIVNQQIKSYKIDENEKAIAILEINPISKGHTIIIPKEHISSQENFPPELFELSKKISENIKEKLNPIEISSSSSNILGHEILNLIPIYEGIVNKERKKESEEELMKLVDLLKKESEEKKIEERENNEKEILKEKKKKKTKIILPKRIP